MKRILTLITVALIVVASGCKDKCSDTECFSPPGELVFNVIDAATGENLFYNGTLDASSIQVLNLADGSEEDFEFVEGDNQSLIVFQNIGWQTETVNLKVSAGGDVLFQLKVVARRLSGNCCSYTLYDDVDVEQAEFEYDASTGFFNILVLPQ